MTVDEMLEALQALIAEPREQLVAVESVTLQANDWLLVRFQNGRQLAVTVEEFGN